MSLTEHLKKFNIPSDEALNDVLKDALEMGQLKSDFDTEKFTIMSKGPFIAHQFHMLMRQYVLAQSEMRRMLLEKEELERNIKIEKDSCTSNSYLEQTERGLVRKHRDIEIKKMQNQLDLLEVTLVNKISMCSYFEQCRKKLLELNNGPITNEQYQSEEPGYVQWMLASKAKNQRLQALTGVQEGLWEVIDQVQETPLLNESYQVPMGDALIKAMNIASIGSKQITNNEGLIDGIQDQRVRLE